ncbi:MAG: hypothetical protein WDN48_01060 [Pseudolabrys sp.]
MLAEFKAGRVRVLAISGPARLGGRRRDADLQELGADCVIGAWRGVTGPAGLGLAEVKFWAGAIEAAAREPVWQEELARLSWSPLVQTGPDLQAYLAQERAEFVAVLGDLGLLKTNRICRLFKPARPENHS